MSGYTLAALVLLAFVALCVGCAIFEALTRPAVDRMIAEALDAGMSAQSIDYDALRRAASELRAQATRRFDTHGPHDVRGAALWDAAAHIDPDDGNALRVIPPAVTVCTEDPCCETDMCSIPPVQGDS